MDRDVRLRPGRGSAPGRISHRLLPALLVLVAALTWARASEKEQPTPTPTPPPQSDRADQGKTTTNDSSGKEPGHATGAETSPGRKPAPGRQTAPREEPSRPTAASPAPEPTPETRPQEQQAPLSFTDEDLQKYHRPPPDQEEAAG
ncbi:MAG TPA: hypothetical protein VNL37_08600, partial [Candidatus Polarisedimenticolia bacterium]|nr:hypothetical protein [Candidatus Polarisedimenticolia bacterium]